MDAPADGPTPPPPRRPWLRRAAGVLVYLLATLAACEGLARLAFSWTPFVQRVEGRDDASWRLRWARRQAEQPTLYYGFDVHHPVRGWAVRPGVRDLRAFGDRLVNTNSEGLRGRREYASPRPAGVPRILVFGDSFTFGDEVGDDETYCHFLQQLLPHTEVLNLGVHGYGHDQMLLYLREAGPRFRPDVVLLGFVYDDMERNLLGFRDFAKPRFELRGARLELRGTPVPSPHELRAREWRQLRLLDLASMLRSAWDWRSGAAGERMRELTTALLDEFRAEAERLGARPAFAYLPVYGELDKPDLTMTRRERFFFGYCRERGVQSMYLQRFFLQRKRAGESLKLYGHWSAREHRIAAEGMAAYLVEKGLVPAPPPATE